MKEPTKSAVPRSILPGQQIFFFLAGYHARGHYLTFSRTFQKQLLPRRSGFFQRNGLKRAKEWRKVTFMKDWVKSLYIGYLQALDLPQNIFPLQTGAFENSGFTFSFRPQACCLPINKSLLSTFQGEYQNCRPRNAL